MFWIEKGFLKTTIKPENSEIKNNLNVGKLDGQKEIELKSNQRRDPGLNLFIPSGVSEEGKEGSLHP